MKILASAAGLLSWPNGTIRCALGRSGVSHSKHEGDGATPTGCFPLRKILFRADRLARPESLLPVSAIGQHDGWCDDPNDSAYNQPITLPYASRCESLWRDDHVYDVIVVLGHNDDPVVQGAGSAIFLHVAHLDYRPTEGCVAVALSDLLVILKTCDALSQLCIEKS